MPNELILNEPLNLAGSEQASPSTKEKDIDKEIFEGEKRWFSRIKIGLIITLSGVTGVLIVCYAGHSIWEGEWDRIEKFAIAVSTGIISSTSVSYFFKH